MKIALVTLDYPPETGGVANYLSHLVRCSHGEVDVFVNLTHSTTGPGRVEAVQLLRSGFWSWAPAISFFRTLRSRGYNHALVSHLIPIGTAAMIAKWLGGVEYSLIIHGLDLRLAEAHPRKSRIAKAVMNHASHIFTNSEAVATEVKAFSGRTPVVVTPGTEEQVQVPKEEARRALNISENADVILSVGRMVPRKGFDTLIRALEYLPANRSLAIVGNGDDRARLEELAKDYGKRVRLVTDADDKTRDLWYSAADVFAMPVRDEGNDVEGFGIVFLEAAAHGLAVVAGRSGGAVEAVEDGETGLLVDANDPVDVAKRIDYLFTHKDRRNEMGRKGKARVKSDFSWEDRYALIKRTISS